MLQQLLLPLPPRPLLLLQLLIPQLFFDLDAAGPDIAAWEPERPEGEGWFVGSIHDTEDGPVCIWLREKVAA